MRYRGNKSWVVPPEDTPYQRTKQEWDRRMGDSIVRAKNWRLFALLLLFLVALSTVGLVYGVAQRQVVPYYVEVYPDGKTLSRGVVHGAYGEVTEPMIRYQLRFFIEALRTVSSDQEVIRENWLKAYHMMSDASANILDEYMQNKETNPFYRSGKERVQISIESILPVSQSSWEIQWIEVTRDLSGSIREKSRWKGVFHVDFAQSSSEEMLENNPLGLYVINFSWTRVKE